MHSCETCQKTKVVGQGYGHHTPREAQVRPWYEIAVDLVGTWILHDEDGNGNAFSALTIMDTVTNYCEIVLLRNKTTECVGL